MTDRETPAGAVEALAAALHEVGIGCMQPLALSRDVCVPTDPRYADFHPLAAKAILAALLGYSLTRSVHVERWQRIETAAREHVEVVDRYEKSQGDASMRLIDSTEAALRDALGEG